MITFTRQLAVIGFVLSTVNSIGCVSSLKPLSDEKTSIPDVRLLGTWEYENKKMQKSTAVVSRKKDSPNVLEVVVSDENEKVTAELFLTKIGHEHFVSVSLQGDDGSATYFIAKYELTDDGNLKLRGLDNEFFAAAVEKNELKGTIDKKKSFFKDVTLDDTPENLRKFLEKHGEKCLIKGENEGVVKRLGPKVN